MTHNSGSGHSQRERGHYREGYSFNRDSTDWSDSFIQIGYWRQIDRTIDKQRQIEKQRARQADRSIDRQINGQIDRQIDQWIDRLYMLVGRWVDR